MMGKVTLRNLAAHKIRLVLTAVAVILGVAFVAGTLIFTDSMNKQFDDLFSRIGTNVAVDVRAKKVIEGDDDGMAAQPVPATVLRTLQGIDGVKDPKGNVNGYAAVVGKDGKIIGTAQDGPPQIGTNWSTGGTYDLASGRAPQGPDEVVIDAKSAEKGKLAVGDTTRVLTAGPPARMRIVGLVDAGNLMGATLTGFDTPTAQRLMLKPGYFSDIEMGSTGPSQTELRDRVAKALPQNLEAVTGEKLREESKSDIAAMMSFFRTFLLVFALISIFVGSFIIFNTFSMLVAQRTRELALLRAIGAARGQVTRAVIGEAVAVGVVGSTLGLAAGAGLASLLQTQMGDAGAGGLTFTATPVIWAYAVGIVVTVVSAYFPARRAAKIPPVAAMRDDVALPQRSLRIRIALGSLLTLVGAGLIGVGLAGNGGNPVVPVGAGAFAVFIGIAMLAPVISVPVMKVLGAPFARLMGPPGRLARQNALRNPRRTAATAAALMIGLALITTVNVLGATMRASIDEQVDAQFGADYLVEVQGAGGISAEAAQQVRATPGVTSSSPTYEGDAKIDNKKAWYMSGDAAVIAKAAKLKITSGGTDLGDAGIMVDEATAKDRGWKVGAAVPVQFTDGRTERLTLTGVYAKSDLVGPRLISQQAHLRHTVRPAVTAVLVDASAPSAATKSALESSLKDYPNLKVSDQASLKADARKQVDGFVTFLTILLVMSVIIAAVGVINTLALSVIERTREIGLLRAIGISRRQLRRMVRLESIMIAVFGAVLGMGIGVAFGAALQNALADKGLGVLAVPYATLGIYLVVAAVIGVLAALWPAWRAGRMDVLKAISTE
ncbi:ABC transporter permease [Actinomadura mexicana]|uniref:Putative ABC transport system permease protein n=1 Tax=Actinomadura mexicana TaxID=134959 RepID=A0A238ZHF4_9ACTN|nr:FtsX family ABC transporter permease [Actinomadura mexicana]SNR82650.1 putative ABC transport system permease protein [Actinomadura mexicana]